MLKSFIALVYVLGMLAALGALVADMTGRPRWLQCRCPYLGQKNVRHLRTGATVFQAAVFGAHGFQMLTRHENRVDVVFGLIAVAVAALCAWDAWRHHNHHRATTPAGDRS